MRVYDEGASAHAATEKAPNQIFVVALKIPARERFVFFELFLHPIEGFFIDDGGDGNDDPLLPGAPFALRLASLLEGMIGSLALNPTATVVVADAIVGFVGEDLSNRRDLISDN